MRVQTFLGKVSMDSLHQMDQHINQWLEMNHIEPRAIAQTFGYDKPKEGCSIEPVVITSVWY